MELFLTVDPLVAMTGQPYIYAGDNPVNMTDPFGLFGWNPISDATQAAGDVGGFVAKHKTAITEIAVGVAVVAAVVVVSVLTGGIADAVGIGAAAADAEVASAVAGGSLAGLMGITFSLDATIALMPLVGVAGIGAFLAGYGVYQLFGGGSSSTKSKSACPA